MAAAEQEEVDARREARMALLREITSQMNRANNASSVQALAEAYRLVAGDPPVNPTKKTGTPL